MRSGEGLLRVWSRQIRSLQTQPFHTSVISSSLPQVKEEPSVTDVSQWERQRPRDLRLESKLFGRHVERGEHFAEYDSVPVSIHGSDAPAPITEIDQLNLHPFLAENVDRYGYRQLTPVQKFAVPIIMAQRDLIASAQTGSGKTAAFLWPIVQRILNEKPSRARQGKNQVEIPTGLVLAPTRELCRQIYSEALKFSYRTAVKPCLLHGGVGNYRVQLDALQRGCNLMIATPGRLNDILSQRLLELNMCQILVLDEADRMLDMGFEPQIREIIEQSSLPPTAQRQTAMFTATFAKEIQVLAKQFLRPNHLFLEIGKVGSACANITQEFLLVTAEDKMGQLKNLVNSYGSESLCLIFANQKSTVDKVTNELCNMGFPAVKIHGDLSQNQRERNLLAFRSGNRVKILVATDVAARGLDIPQVSHVVNFDFPLTIDDYVHRIGRTGRMGNAGTATSFVDSKMPRSLLGDLRDLLGQSGQEVPDFLGDLESVANENHPKYKAKRGKFAGPQGLRGV